jgi:hypothetical protein
MLDGILGAGRPTKNSVALARGPGLTCSALFESTRVKLYLRWHGGWANGGRSSGSASNSMAVTAACRSVRVKDGEIMLISAFFRYTLPGAKTHTVLVRPPSRATWQDRAGASQVPAFLASRKPIFLSGPTCN